MKIYQLEDDSIERHKGERKVHGVDDDTMSVTDSVATESDLTADTNSVTIDTDSDSENDSKSENNENNERLQESDSENNKSESKNDSGDGVQWIKAERTEESDKEEVSFPDTSISLQHVKGDKYVTSTSTTDCTVHFQIEVKDPQYDLSQHFLISKFYCWC